jgi:glycosyltransferase involved in cell wall biosynthesis
MRIIALIEVYNAVELVEKTIRNRMPFVDDIYILDGSLAALRDQPKQSTDGTVELIKKLGNKFDNVHILPPISESLLIAKGNSRENQHGANKNYMLKFAKPEPGDIIHLADVDEFYLPEGFTYLLNIFQQNETIQHIIIEEFQFAYNLKLCFNALHDGRFFRYKKGARYTASNHFIVDGQDISKDDRVVVPRCKSKMLHLCWVQHPIRIRDKVLTFQRDSFTKWYNNRYLIWPRIPDNKGFAEGQQMPLYEYQGNLPKELTDFQYNYILDIQQNWREYLI